MLPTNWQLHSASHRLDASAATVPEAHRGLAAIILLRLIAIYRRVLSPMLGPHCRFHPTCSTYATHAIERYGALGGGARAVGRLLRCHPFSAGGYDPLH